MSPPLISHTDKPKVLLASLAAPGNPTLTRLRETARRHPPRGFQLTERADAADLVLYVESGYVGLGDIARNTALLRAGKPAFMLSESDWPFPFLPGLYCSLGASRRWARSWSFLLDDRPDDGPAPPGTAPDATCLFSFIGRLGTHPCRLRVRALDTPDTPCLDVGEGPQRFPDWNYAATYDRLLRQSRFVLCPRGIGASSIRIFETMRAGRVPVIISDRWQPPPGIAWDTLSLNVAEADIGSIPELCRRHAHAAGDMGQRARMAFGRQFAPPVFLDRVMATCLSELGTAQPGAARAAWRIARSTSARELRTLARDLLRPAASMGRA